MLENDAIAKQHGTERAIDQAHADAATGQSRRRSMSHPDGSAEGASLCSPGEHELRRRPLAVSGFQKDAVDMVSVRMTFTRSLEEECSAVSSGLKMVFGAAAGVRWV